MIFYKHKKTLSYIKINIQLIIKYFKIINIIYSNDFKLVIYLFINFCIIIKFGNTGKTPNFYMFDI